MIATNLKQAFFLSILWTVGNSLFILLLTLGGVSLETAIIGTLIAWAVVALIIVGTVIGSEVYERLDS